MGVSGMNPDALFARLESMQEVIKEVNEQFSDAVRGPRVRPGAKRSPLPLTL